MSAFNEVLNRVTNALEPVKKAVDKFNGRTERFVFEQTASFQKIAGNLALTDVHSSGVFAEKIEAFKQSYVDLDENVKVPGAEGYIDFRKKAYPIFREVVSDVSDKVLANSLYLPMKELKAYDIYQIVTDTFNSKNEDGVSYIQRINDASKSTAHPTVAVELEVNGMFKKVAEIFKQATKETFVESEKPQQQSSLGSFFERNFTAC
jgi:hypothetical protein